ncbi:MAG: segregation/condensation protein A [Candidatus Hydrogenedentes bacterium]|nr:segregation/condensation protein A [Candidatus Hydrogenedentota bacterium]
MTDQSDAKVGHEAAKESVAGSFIVDQATDEVLRLHLDKFEGPFEVLLYLIRSQEIDIFDIPILRITEQYLRFLELMREENLDVAGEFLVMAATLIQIKAKMLVPAELDQNEEEEIEEGDPRLELVEKLLEYRRYRDVAARLQFLEGERQGWFARHVKPEPTGPAEEEEYLEVALYDLIDAFKGVLRYVSDDLFHTVQAEQHSVDEKIARIEELLFQRGSLSWMDLFRECKSRIELICCFLAILELCRIGRIRAHQHRVFDEIRLVPAQEGAKH